MPALKRLLVIPDGASDAPIPELDGRTPLEAAATPTLDRLARTGEAGRLVTVPKECEAGSDVANLSLLGIDPRTVEAERGPLEAAAAGVEVPPDALVYRVNLVSLSGSGPFETKTLEDFTAGHIDNDAARSLLARFAGEAERLGARLHPGVSYRHLLVVPGREAARTRRAHEIVGEPIGPNLPEGEGAEVLRALIEASARAFADESPPKALWPWGGGRPVALPRLSLEGVVVTAVDLIRGIGRLRGLAPIDVPGATGYYDTDYDAKARAAGDALADGADFALVHVEAPDEAGHEGNVAEKVRSIEAVSERVVAPLVERFGTDLSLLIAPDHPTFLATRSHGDDPVPYVLAGPGARKGRTAPCYCERALAGCAPEGAWARVAAWLSA